MRDIWTALIAARLWPEGAEIPPASADIQYGVDFLPALIAAWSGVVTHRSGAAAKSAAGKLDLLQRARQTGAALTWGSPGVRPDRWTRWLGGRLVWWPRGVPAGRRVGLVSSRLGRDLDRQHQWFNVLRTACMKLDPRQDLIVTSDSIAPHRFVNRCAALFGLRVLVAHVDDRDNRTMRPWGQRALTAEAAPPDGCHHAYLSPPIAAAAAGEATRELADLPVADRLVAAMSDELIALRVRPDGNLDRLLTTRLGEEGIEPASTFLALGPDLVRRATAERLLDLGAVGWYVTGSQGSPRVEPSPLWRTTEGAADKAAPIIPCPTGEDWTYLTHCTRTQAGPWPDQEERAYLDDLILDRSGADHSAFAALWRIVRSRRLLATRALIRGDTPVVSFTAVPLDQIHNLRAFRSHLGRWDFEPYGICIRRDWLLRRGTRPVCYGDQSLWEQLPDEQRPFFQKSESRSETGAVVDWTVEQEWRHLGDVALSRIPDPAAFLFVPTQIEAEQLSAISRWPIAVVP